MVELKKESTILSFGYKTEDAIYKQESANIPNIIYGNLDIPITEWLKTALQYGGFLNKELYP